MQDQAEIETFAAELAMTPEAFAAHLRLRHLAGALLLVAHHGDAAERDAASDLCDEWQARAGAGSPGFSAEHARAEAFLWAELASRQEIEAYLVACLAAAGSRAMALASRKRLFAALWETMPEDDRRAFVRRVDPQGRFHRGAA